MSCRPNKYPKIFCYICGFRHPHCSCTPLNWPWGGFPMQLQERWQGARVTPKPLTRRDRAAAILLYSKGYVQKSRKYNLVDTCSNGQGWDNTPFTTTEPVLRALRALTNHLMRLGIY